MLRDIYCPDVDSIVAVLSNFLRWHAAPAAGGGGGSGANQVK